MHILPPLRHDELFESWLFKVFQYNDSSIFCPNRNKEFGIRDIRKLKAHDILDICLYVQNYLKLNFMDIINKNTLFPYITPFCDSPEYMDKHDKMNYLIYLNSVKEYYQSYFILENPKVCIDCINEEINTFGGAYIHRAHQIPGNFFCIKHNSKLKMANNFHYGTSDYLKMDLKDPIRPDEIYTDKLRLLSQDIYDISNGILNSFNIDYIMMSIWIIMYEKGYINNMAIKSKFYSDFYEYHDYFYLKQLDNSLFYFREDIFNFRRLILKPGWSPYYYSPIQIILIIRMLFDCDIKEFINYSRKQSTYDKLHRLKNLFNKKSYKYINCGFYFSEAAEEVYEHLLEIDS